MDSQDVQVAYGRVASCGRRRAVVRVRVTMCCWTDGAHRSYVQRIQAIACRMGIAMYAAEPMNSSGSKNVSRLRTWSV